jgi:hypothetical protein
MTSSPPETSLRTAIFYGIAGKPECNSACAFALADSDRRAADQSLKEERAKMTFLPQLGMKTLRSLSHGQFDLYLYAIVT